MSSNLRKIAKKFIFIRKKHIFVFFLDKIVFLCFCYINSHIWVLWWRHTFIHVRFIAFLCVCVCVVFVGVVFVRCVCVFSVCLAWIFLYMCIVGLFMSLLWVCTDCAPHVFAASVRRKLRRMRALCAQDMFLHMCSVCFSEDM